MRAFLLALTLLLSSCAWGPVVASRETPATAKGVVLQAKDLAFIQKCPQSDRWAGLMLKGAPEMLPTGFATWADLKVAGATDGWMSIYADIVSECPLLFGFAPPAGRAAPGGCRSAPPQSRSRTHAARVPPEADGDPYGEVFGEVGSLCDNELP